MTTINTTRAIARVPKDATYYKELHKRAYSPREYAFVWSISIGKVRKDLASGALPHFRIGRRVCIPVSYDPSKDIL